MSENSTVTSITSLADIELGSDSVCARKNAYLHAAARTGTVWFSSAGAWAAPSFPLKTRERFWFTLALYQSGQIELADTIIRASDTDKSHEMRRASTFDVFHTNIATMLLLLHGDAMAPDVRLMLEKLVREGFASFAGNRQPDYQFHGYNDNMPAKATLGLILGGERFGCCEAVEHGVWNLRHLAAQLSRRGINSEFNSPTYTPLTIHAMAEIARHAHNAEARALAGDIETRLWIDVASRFHSATGRVAGPYSRAYTVDLTGHFSVMSALLWFVLGERAWPSPMGLCETDCDEATDRMVLHHCNNKPFNVAQMCWFAAGEYQIPEAAWRLFDSPFPRHPARSVATAETGAGEGGFPARPVRVETWMSRDYAVGTSSSLFLNGDQCAPWFVTYAKQNPVRSIRDTGTMFWKFLLDDAAPGRMAHEHPEYENLGEEDNTHSRGNAITLQSESTALLLSHPWLQLGDSPAQDQCPPKHRRLSEVVALPSHFGRADEIMVGNQSRSSWAGEAGRGAWIGFRRGSFLTAIRPLAYTRDFGCPVISLEKSGAYELVRTTFYHGEARSFSQNELRWIFGGFVAEHGLIEEYGSLASFMNELEAGRFTDYFWTTRRVRYERPHGHVLPRLAMDVSWSPGSQQTRYSLINDKLVDWPVVDITDVETEKLPFLGENNGIAIPGELPWDRIVCAQADWPALIGEKPSAS